MQGILAYRPAIPARKQESQECRSERRVHMSELEGRWDSMVEMQVCMLGIPAWIG